VGFFQILKRSQIFGYARLLRTNLEWHARAFVDETLESELEASRTTIQHLLKPTYVSDGLLAQLLTRHRIPFSNVPNPYTRQNSSTIR